MDEETYLIHNFAIGLSSYSNLYNLDLHRNEYLVVGQRANPNPNQNTKDIKYNLIVNNHGIGVNASRNEINTSSGMYISDDIVCKGRIITNSIEIQGVDLNSNLNQNIINSLINIASCNIFYQGYNKIKNYDNKYTTSFLTLGAYTDTYSNLHPLNIVHSGNNTIENNHICIQNDINNDIEPCKFNIGIIGNAINSPAVITTTDDMSLEFHISKKSTLIDQLYSCNTGLPNYDNYNLPPAMKIMPNNCIGINTSINEQINYNQLYFDGYYLRTNTPSLKVDGLAYINYICMYDYYSKSIKSLDDIFVRREGLTLYPNQIMGGEFSSEPYTFISNVSIGKSNKPVTLTIYNYAKINGTLEVTDYASLQNVTIFGITNFNNQVNFNNPVHFNNDIGIQNDLTVIGNLFLDGVRINANPGQTIEYPLNTFSYANNSFNISGTSNIVIGGKLGVGVRNTESYNNQLTINKHDSTYFQVLIQDFNNNFPDISKVYIGHSIEKSLSDNSFVFFTQKNIRQHNIYFYAGKDLNSSTYPNLNPTLAIMQNDKVGINTKIPQKTLDVNGDIIAINYYSKDGLIKNLINKNDNIMLSSIKSFNINIDDISIYNNPVKFNVSGGINSYDGYYINNNKICPIVYKSSTNAILNTNLGIGVSEQVSVPLQIRNNNLNMNNNSVLRFYRGKTSGKYNALYSGIDICDYDTQLPIYDRNNFKWYIYKYHIDNSLNNQIGPLQIGYTNNTYNPTISGITIYYDPNNLYHIDINKPIVDYNYNKSAAMSIYGDLEVYGNINIIGDKNYKYNGINIGNFSNISIGISKESQQSNHNLIASDSLSTNDISLIGNKLILLSSKTTIIGFKDDWVINNITYLGTIDNPIDNIPLYIYQNKYNTSALKIYTKNFNNNNQPDISKIELGLINQLNNTGIITNKIELSLKGFNNINIFEITPINIINNPFISFVANESNNYYTHIGSSQNSYNNANGIPIYDNIALHVDDNSKYLLQLTNQVCSPAINLHKKTDKNYNWHLNGPDIKDNSFNIQYESTDFNNNSISYNQILKITPEGKYFFNSNISENINTNNTININSIYNNSSLLLTNNYNSNQLFDKEDTIIINNSNLIYNFNSSFDNNTTINNKFKYFIATSNLPLKNSNNNSIDYYLNNSNINFNNNFTVTTNYTLNNLLVNYEYTNINNNPSELINNNLIAKNIELLPNIISRNPNYKYTINSSSKQTYNQTVFTGPNNIFSCINYYVYPIGMNNSLNITNTNTYFSNISYYHSNLYRNTITTSYYTVPFNENIVLTNSLVFNDYNMIIDNNNITHIIYTTNIIKYNSSQNINILSVNAKIDNIFNINNNINAPVSIIKQNAYNNFNYNISIDNNLITVNSYTSFLEERLDNNDYLNNIKENILISTNNFNYLFELDINDSNQKIIKRGIIQTNNYFSIYDFTDPKNIDNITLFIYYNKYKPHITLQNYIDYDNYKYENIHKIYSYNGYLDFYVDNTKLVSIDSIGNTNITGDINTNNLKVNGDIFDKNGNSIIPNLNSDIYLINSSNTYLVNSSNIAFNNSCGFLIGRDNINPISTNLFQLNGGNNGDTNFITLNSSSTGSLIHYTSIFDNYNYLYRTGIKNNSFGIWMYNNDNTNHYIDGSINSFNNYNNAFNITYNTNNNNFDYQINGNINIDNPIKFVNNSQDIIKINTLIHDYKFEVNGNILTKGDIKVDGNLLTSSDKRFKNDIKKIDDALNKLIKLNGIIYTNSLTNEKNSGLIAQEVLEILPEVVKNDSNDYLTIAYGNMMGLVIEAIKELKTEINYIKSKI